MNENILFKNILVSLEKFDFILDKIFEFESPTKELKIIVVKKITNNIETQVSKILFAIFIK